MQKNFIYDIYVVRVKGLYRFEYRCHVGTADVLFFCFGNYIVAHKIETVNRL